MTKGDNKNFKNSTKCWICDNYYIDIDVNVGDHCISLENKEVVYIEIVISILN